MNNFIVKFAFFTVGAAIGSAVTWKLVKTKYEQLAQEEIDSVKQIFHQHRMPVNSVYGAHPEAKTESNVKKSDTITEYKNYASNYTSENEEKGEPEIMDRPYVISPEEFGEGDYETISLTFYADKVLTDETGDIVEDVDNLVGLDSLTHFGEYEDDSVFVRNDATNTDYEILLDTRNYMDVFDVPPHLVR